MLTDNSKNNTNVNGNGLPFALILKNYNKTILIEEKLHNFAQKELLCVCKLISCLGDCSNRKVKKVKNAIILP